jgi:ankyrin repeat protein
MGCAEPGRHMSLNHKNGWWIALLMTIGGGPPSRPPLHAQGLEARAARPASDPSRVTGTEASLVEAAKKRDGQAVRALLKQRADVNARQGDGSTALHWGVYWDEPEIVAVLLGVGADVNAANDYGATPLWLACNNGSARLVEMLLEAGANPNAALSSGETPLMTASRVGSTAAVKALLARGADANAKERLRGQTALMWAVAQQHADVVQVLIELKADLHARSDVRTRRVNRGPDGTLPSLNPSRDLIDERQGGFTPLLFAARQGSLESARLLVAAGANVNDVSPAGTSALVIASHSGHGNLAAFLLEKGADPNTSEAGYTALHAAVLRGDVALVKSLVAHGANPNAVLMEATPARRASQDWAMNLTWIGASPLWMAARFANAEIMRVLADSGADRRFVMPNGTTVLMAPLGGGADRRSRIGLTLPEDPVETERAILAATQMAIDLGIDLNAVNEAGDTALHTASARRLNSVVQLLAERGAALDVKNKKGQTPLAMASIPRRTPDGLAQTAGAVGPSTADLLRKLGARE